MGSGISSAATTKNGPPSLFSSVYSSGRRDLRLVKGSAARDTDESQVSCTKHGDCIPAVLLPSLSGFKK